MGCTLRFSSSTSGGLVPMNPAEFGRTGHHSSRVIFGGAALAQVSQRVADETLDVLLAHGVNHLDLASSYGEAEARVRPWLQREPGRFFLATKGDDRTGPWTGWASTTSTCGSCTPWPIRSNGTPP